MLSVVDPSCSIIVNPRKWVQPKQISACQTAGTILDGPGGLSATATSMDAPAGAVWWWRSMKVVLFGGGGGGAVLVVIAMRFLSRLCDKCSGSLTLSVETQSRQHHPWGVCGKETLDNGYCSCRGRSRSLRPSSDIDRRGQRTRDNRKCRRRTLTIVTETVVAVAKATAEAAKQQRQRP